MTTVVQMSLVAVMNNDKVLMRRAAYIPVGHYTSQEIMHGKVVWEPGHEDVIVHSDDILEVA